MWEVGGAVKRCTKCKRTLPEESFSRDRSNPDGLQKHCKDCQREYNHRYNHDRIVRYTAEELLSLPYYPHRIETLEDAHAKALNYRDLAEELGVKESTLCDWRHYPDKYIGSVELNDDILNLAMTRVLEAQVRGN